MCDRTSLPPGLTIELYSEQSEQYLLIRPYLSLICSKLKNFALVRVHSQLRSISFLGLGASFVSLLTNRAPGYLYHIDRDASNIWVVMAEGDE